MVKNEFGELNFHLNLMVVNDPPKFIGKLAGLKVEAGEKFIYKLPLIEERENLPVTIGVQG